MQTYFKRFLTFKFKAAQCPQGQRDAAHIAGLWDVCEARGGQLVSQAFGHPGMTQGLVHQN